VKWRTTTRPNGDPQHRETVWGWDVILPRLVHLISVVALVWYVSAWCHAVRTDIDDARLQIARQPAVTKETIAAALAEHDIAAEAVTRAEWLEGERTRDAAVAHVADKVERLTESTYRLNFLLEHYQRSEQETKR
jgi:hypothetical protein